MTSQLAVSRRLVSAAIVALSSWVLAGCGSGAPDFVRANTTPAPSPIVVWPKPTGEVQVDGTIRVLDHFDGKGQRFYGVDDLGTSSQDENQDPMFRLSDGAVLENVIIGDPAADGVHCYGSCTLKNVWWERVGEDAATFRGQQPDDVMIIDKGGASGAKDKVFQNNGLGTMVVKNFYVENFGKLYRSCGNCSKQVQRTIVLENITALAGKKSSCLVGLNENYGDKVIFKGTSHVYIGEKPKFPVCQRFLGNARGLEPSKTTTGPDKNCQYDEHNVIIE